MTHQVNLTASGTSDLDDILAKATPSDIQPAVPAKHHNAVLRAATERALELEDLLVEVLIPIFEKAGDVAARNYQLLVTDHLTAAGDEERLFGVDNHAVGIALAAAAHNPNSTMVCLKPTADQAAILADSDGAPPEQLHVTLASLGGYDGDLRLLAEAVAPAAACHPPLSGTVAGYGQFMLPTGPIGILLPDVPGLVELRVDVTEALVMAGIDYGRDHGYQPHMTVDTSPEPDELAMMLERAGTPLTFDAILIVRGDTEILEVPLVGTPALTASAVSDVGARIAEVAEQHRPDGGYGDTAWNADEQTVFWVSADWTTNDEEDAAHLAFLDIPEVKRVKSEAEAALPDGDDWEIVYRSGAWGLTAAGEMQKFCLPAELRTKTDPVRQAVVRTVMGTSVEKAGLNFDVTNPFTKRVLSQSGSQIVNISKTTQVDVMRTIDASYEQGLTIPDTAKAIRAVMRDSAPARARLIARTELAGATNGGSLAATQIVASATDTTYVKTWLTAPGAKNPRHEEYDGLDGQTVGLDEDFDVGGSNLQFPGDPDGDPGEVCNCRCTMTYDEPGGGEGESEDLEASAHVHGEQLLSIAQLDELLDGMIALRAAAGWTAPGADEILPINCEKPGTTATTLPVHPSSAERKASEQMTPLPDTLSVGAGAPVDTFAQDSVREHNLDEWPPRKGPVAQRLFGDLEGTDGLYGGVDGGEYTVERSKLHTDIIDRHFRGKRITGERRAFLTSGGSGAGKGSSSFILDGKTVTLDELQDPAGPYFDRFVFINADDIKEMIPEYKLMRDAGEIYAASGVHEESSTLAKEIIKEARARGYDVVIDGTGSSSSFEALIDKSAADEYDVHVTMTSIPTNRAIERSILRGEKRGRYVAMPPLKGAHRGASAQFLKWRDDPNVAAWRLFDNTVRPPVLVAEGGGGKRMIVHNKKLLKAIELKATE